MTKQQTPTLPAPSPLTVGREPAHGIVKLQRFALATAFLTLCFAAPLWHLVRFAFTSAFHSYILLVPFVTACVVWLKREDLPHSSQRARLGGGIFLMAGFATLAVYWISLRSRLKHAEDDYLAVMMVAFLLLFFGICCLFWGRDTLRRLAFPLGLLVFIVPIPTCAMPPINSFLQDGSAVAAQIFFGMSGAPFFRDGLIFHLPNISLQISPQCSGIQSSIILLFVGLEVSYLFLKTPWKRVLLTLSVIPLALIRNGFRVFTIGELCVHIGPQMINSPIHRKGGLIFLVLSLVPLFVLWLVLNKSERAYQNDPRSQIIDVRGSNPPQSAKL